VEGQHRVGLAERHQTLDITGVGSLQEEAAQVFGLAGMLVCAPRLILASSCARSGGGA
jgi:hypothetical protein